MQIKDALAMQPKGAVVADSDGHLVRLWVLTPEHPSTRAALVRVFPSAEFRSDGLCRLGGWRRFGGSATTDLAAAKTGPTRSRFVRALHLFESSDGAGFRSIREAGLL